MKRKLLPLLDYMLYAYGPRECEANVALTRPGAYDDQGVSGYTSIESLMRAAQMMCPSRVTLHCELGGFDADDIRALIQDVVDAFETDMKIDVSLHDCAAKWFAGTKAWGLDEDVE